MARLEIVHAGSAGRLRLRSAEIRRAPGLARRLERHLEHAPAVRQATARPATGSVIVHVVPGTTPEAVLCLVEDGLRAAGNGPDKPAPPPHDADAGWHGLSVAEIAERLDTDPDAGLADAEAADRLARDGPNRLPRDGPRPRAALFADQFRSLPVAMLAGSSIVSLAGGAFTDAIATLSVVMANAVLGYVTEAQAEAAIHQLMDSSAEEVSVLRGGVERRVPAAELVSGDLYLLGPGVQIAADARLVAASHLRVDESALSGETLPAHKDPGAAMAPNAPIGSRPGMVHAGTIVAEGSGRGIVVATGARTAAAQIAHVSQTATRPRAPVEAELDRLGAGLAKLSFAACLAFLGIGWLRGTPAGVILKDALALTVAAVPEGLPVVATVTMARGLRRMERDGVLVRQISAVESLGALQTICLDKTGTLTRNAMTVSAGAAGLRRVAAESPALAPLAEVAALNNDAEPRADGALASSPTERALLDFAVARGIDVPGLRRLQPRRETVQRGPERPWMATVHGGAAPRMLVKGAPGALLPRCASIREGGNVRPLTEADRVRLHALNEDLAASPARVLAFAEGPADAGRDPGDLTWLGLLALTDPLRPGAAEFVEAMQGAGIDLVIITGDQAATAEALARQLDLGRGGPIRVVDSTDLAGLPPGVLAAIARRTHVFARVSAHQKLAIVRALQAAGRTVGMTGDGVNDGPALKAADVGIAMGAGGTRLAREVANVVIRDDRLETLAGAIGQGRAVRSNIRRALEYLITTNMSEILVGLVEALHGPNELETPMELLWINLVTDVMPGLGLASAEPGRDAMITPPRLAEEPIIGAADYRRRALDGSTIAVSALAAHFFGLARHGPGPATRGVTFLSLSLGQLLYTLICQHREVRHIDPRQILSNRPLDVAILGSMVLATLPYAVPGLRRLLGIVPLGPLDTAVALGAAAAPTAVALARGQVQQQLETIEGKPCEIS